MISEENWIKLKEMITHVRQELQYIESAIKEMENEQ